MVVAVFYQNTADNVSQLNRGMQNAIFLRAGNGNATVVWWLMLEAII